ncbi:hypothetical protein [Ochrobactrum sp. EDr1-4]|uniref:hypothetical protein n=1 Tax=Ochrobactrum sp. EDr1-4 TaxID=3368622 RepID=UPI003B9E7E97
MTKKEKKALEALFRKISVSDFQLGRVRKLIDDLAFIAEIEPKTHQRAINQYIDFVEDFYKSRMEINRFATRYKLEVE